MRHRWMVVMPYEVTREDARRVATGDGVPSQDEVPPTELAADEKPTPGDARPYFGLHNVVQELVGVICWTCEQPYSDDVADRSCPGEPGQKLAYVDEHGRDLHPDEVAVRGTTPGARFAGVGRNDPCPCGSRKKFKHCHGARS